MDILINKRKRIVVCPCCEYKMLGERNDWEICVVCKWEDDCLQADEPDQLEGPIKNLKKGVKEFLGNGCMLQKITALEKPFLF